MNVEAGKKAPDFTAPTDGGKKLKLSDLRGKPVVLYFYPKDDTSGCTAEARFSRRPPDFSPRSKRRSSESEGTASRATTSSRRSTTLPAGPRTRDGKICGEVRTWIEKSSMGASTWASSVPRSSIDKAGTIAAVWHKKVPGPCG